VAFVVPADPASPPTAAELQRWCRERLADYKTPDRVEFLDAMPMTTMMMKIDKKALGARLTQ
jgi:non-ribosomal peptide synthetase component E (peptide arylation enzyme)